MLTQLPETTVAESPWKEQRLSVLEGFFFLLVETKGQQSLYDSVL